MKKSKILIIEDEFITAMDMQRSLENLHYQVVGIGRSGEEAIAMARKFQPDLVLMDVSLNGQMKGTEAAMEIRKFMPVPVIFITAYSDHETVRRAAASCPYGYLTKPFNVRDLGASVEIALLKFRMEKQTTAEAERVRKEFLHSMSHEMQAQLNGIIGFAESMNKSMTDLTEIQHGHLCDILSSSKYLLGLVDSLGKNVLWRQRIDQ